MGQSFLSSLLRFLLNNIEVYNPWRGSPFITQTSKAKSAGQPEKSSQFSDLNTQHWGYINSSKTAILLDGKNINDPVVQPMQNNIIRLSPKLFWYIGLKIYINFDVWGILNFDNNYCHLWLDICLKHCKNDTEIESHPN